MIRYAAGLLAGTEEAKVSAVRSAALSALKALLEAAGGGGALPALERAAVQGRLTALGSSERSIAISAQVIAMHHEVVATPHECKPQSGATCYPIC